MDDQVTEEEVTGEPEEETALGTREFEALELLPQPEPPTPIRPLESTKADLEKQLASYKAFVAELESTRVRLEQASAQEEELLSRSASEEGEQLEALSRTLALKKVLERSEASGSSFKQ